MVTPLASSQLPTAVVQESGRTARSGPLLLLVVLLLLSAHFLLLMLLSAHFLLLLLLLQSFKFYSHEISDSRLFCGWSESFPELTISFTYF